MEKLGGGPGALGSAPRDAQKCTHLVSSPFMGGGGSHGVSPGVAAWLLDSHGPPPGMHKAGPTASRRWTPGWQDQVLGLWGPGPL